MRTWVGVLAFIALSGCLVTVNGKTYNSLSEAMKGSNDPQSPPAESGQPAANQPASAEPAAAPGLVVELDPATSPNPLVIDVGAVPTPVSDTKNYLQCRNSDSYMSAAPVARLVVKAKTKLRLLSKNSGLITLPGDKFRCYEHDTIGAKGLIFVHEGEYEPGTYDVYAMGKQGSNVSTHLELVIVDRVPQDAAKRLDAAAPIEAKLQGSTNPAYASFDVQPGTFQGEHLKLDCAKGRSLIPVTRLVVSDASTWRLSTVREHAVYLQGPDGKCVKDGGDLPKGSYGVFVDAWDVGAKVDLALVDEERGLSFAEAPHVDPGDLKKPVPVEVTIPASEFKPKPLCGAGARTPSFFIDVKKPMTKVSLGTLVADGDVDWAVAGPLDQTKRPYEWCKTGGRYWEKLEKGTYAVWVSAKDPAAVGQKAYARLMGNFDDHVVDQKAEGEPLAKLMPVPAEPALKDRQVWWYYPYYRRDTKAVEALFLDAPPQLFVFLTTDADAVKAGEALLLARWGAEKSEVIRANGERKEVRTERLTTAKPAKVLVPEDWPEIARPNDIKDGYAITSPTDLPKFAKWENDEAKRYSCVGNWMSKNDPTWGKNYNLVNLRTGETVTDQKFRQADKVCNSARVEAAAKSLIKDAHKNRLAMREKVKKTLPSKLK